MMVEEWVQFTELIVAKTSRQTMYIGTQARVCEVIESLHYPMEDLRWLFAYLEIFLSTNILYVRSSGRPWLIRWLLKAVNAAGANC